MAGGGDLCGDALAGLLVLEGDPAGGCQRARGQEAAGVCVAVAYKAGGVGPVPPLFTALLKGRELIGCSSSGVLVIVFES